MDNENRRQKFSTRNRQFQNWWTDDYIGVTNKPNKAVCFSCSSSIKSNFEPNHQNGKEQQEFLHRQIKYKHSQSNIIGACFAVSNTIAKHGKPFSDGEYIKEAWLKCAPILFEDFENSANIIQRIKDIPLGRNTIRDRIMEIATNISHQQQIEINSSGCFSLCIDGSTDITGSTRLAIFIRYPNGNNINEEMISLTATTPTTEGIDIYNAVVRTLAQKEIDPFKTVSITTDGSHHMIGDPHGFVNLFTKLVGHPIVGFHCIIHQQALTGLKSLDDIMITVTELINFISASPSNKRKFSQLLTEVNSAYNCSLMHNNLRWLSRGRILQKFIDSLEEIILFLNAEKLTEKYKQLTDPEWLSKLMFYTDLNIQLNDLITKLQCENKTIIILHDIIKAFETKLDIFNRDITSNAYKYFPKTNQFLISRENIDKTKLKQQFSEVIQSLINEFALRFNDFESFSETIKLIMFPDVVSPDKLNLNFFEWLNLEDIEMQLTDFQSSSIWKQKFVDLRKDLEIMENNRLSARSFRGNPEEELLKTWNAVPAVFGSLKNLAMAILSIFSSTHASELVFSQLNFIKNKFRNRLSEESTAASVLLKVSKYDPDVKYLSKNKQKQKSH